MGAAISKRHVVTGFIHDLLQGEVLQVGVRVDDDAILIEQASGEILYVAYDLEARRTVS